VRSADSVGEAAWAHRIRTRTTYVRTPLFVASPLLPAALAAYVASSTHTTLPSEALRGHEKAGAASGPFAEACVFALEARAAFACGYGLAGAILGAMCDGCARLARRGGAQKAQNSAKKIELNPTRYVAKKLYVRTLASRYIAPFTLHST
jgi:hypothetical protein